MAAAFREGLILDMEARDAGALEGLDRLARVQRVAVTGIHIGDRGNPDRIDDLRQARGDLGQADQPHIGNARAARHPAAGDIDRREAGRLDQTRRQPIVTAGRHDDPVALDQCT